MSKRRKKFRPNINRIVERPQERIFTIGDLVEFYDNRSSTYSKALVMAVPNMTGMMKLIPVGSTVVREVIVADVRSIEKGKLK